MPAAIGVALLRRVARLGRSNEIAGDRDVLLQQLGERRVTECRSSSFN